MKTCVKCGSSMDDNSRFCPNCGAQQPDNAYGGGAYQGSGAGYGGYGNQYQSQNAYGNGYYGNAGQSYNTYAPVYDIAERSIVLAIIFSLITFGIYYIYWLYKLAEGWNEISESQDQRPGTSPGLVVLFSILTCSIYTIYYWYKMGKQAADLQDPAGTYLEDNSIVCLLLSIFGFDIISAAIMQNELNNYLRYNQMY